MNEKMAESIYSNNSLNVSKESTDDMNPNIISSEYVNNLIEPILSEFQSIILVHGESTVKNLMSLVASCLDTLNRIYSEKHNLEVELELLKDDSSQLMSQYEKEKQMRRKADENLFRAEDCLSEKAAKYEDKIHQLESQIKLNEIRYKNLQEQNLRLEEREVARSEETENLRHRYQDLMKLQVDYMEKTRLSSSEGIRSSMKPSISQMVPAASYNYCKVDSLSQFDHDLSDNEDRLEDKIQYPADENAAVFNDELTEMTHEIEYIIKENDELRATKNALNIVKDDLITKLDEANSEIEVLQHQNDTLNSYRATMKLKVTDIEQECKSLRQENVKLKAKLESQSEDESIPITQRKRFTRLEMARVLMERNHLKEKLNELEEYLKWYKYINSKEKKLTLWEKLSRMFKTDKEIAASRSQIKDSRANNKAMPKKPSITRTRPATVSSCEALQDQSRSDTCGWSIPTNEGSELSVNLPVPVFCRPITETNHNFKISCAVVVEVEEVADGKICVGDSVFYNSQLNGSISDQNTSTTSSSSFSFSITEKNHIWMALTSFDQSQIIITEANQSSEIIDTFIIPHSVVQCIACVPGISEEVSSSTIYDLNNSSHSIVNEFGVTTSVRLVKCLSHSSLNIEEIEDQTVDVESSATTPSVSSAMLSPTHSASTSVNTTMNSTVWIGCEDGNLFMHPANSQSKRSQCLEQIQLPDSITNILYQNNRVFVSLANGKIIVFSRYHHIDKSDKHDSFSKITTPGQWNMSQYLLIENDEMVYPIRAMEGLSIYESLWIGYRNSVIIIDDKSFKQIKRIDVHAAQEYHVRQMCFVGDGVWISLRMDVVLKLFHAQTFQHLQDLNVESHINKLIEPSLLGLTQNRITCINAMENCLWIGINNGMVLCAPFNKVPNEVCFKTVGNDLDKSVDTSIQSIETTVHPVVTPEHIRLSFHGHNDAVKFFLNFYRKCKTMTNPTDTHNSSRLVIKKPVIISGGDGYRDFRTSNHSPNYKLNSTENSMEIPPYMIVWQL